MKTPSVLSFSGLPAVVLLLLAGTPGAPAQEAETAAAAAAAEGVSEADSPPVTRDEVLPRGVTPEHFDAVLKNSPFLRTLDFQKTYALRGIAEIGGRQIATLYNNDTKETVNVRYETPNEKGMKLVEVTEKKLVAGVVDLTGVTAKIDVSGEEVELKFEPSRVAPVPKGPSPGSRGPGGPGGPPPGSTSSSGERRGPSPEDIKRYQSLNDDQKKKLGEYIRQTMQRYPDMSREERGNMIRGALTRLSEGGEIPAGDGNTPPSSSSSSSSSRDGDRNRSSRSSDQGRSGGGGDRDRSRGSSSSGGGDRR